MSGSAPWQHTDVCTIRTSSVWLVFLPPATAEDCRRQQLRPRYMPSSPVGLITATTSCMMPLQFILAHCKMFSIQRHVSYCGNRDAITLLLTFATSSTGCQLNRGSSTRCACLYTSVYISQHPSTSPSYASQLQHQPNTFSCVRQPHHLVLQD